MREAVCLILRRDDKILGVSRRDDHTIFGFIGGKKDETDNSPEEAIIRECIEETGIKPFNLKLIDKRVYGISEETTYLQHCFIGDFTGEPHSNTELILRGEGILKWLTIEELEKGFFGEYNKMMIDSIYE